jgi:hypothetical protein
MAFGHCVTETQMTVDDFRQSLTEAKPPAELTPALAALWWDAKGDWKRAHESAQRDEGIEGSWVHEGDETAWRGSLNPPRNNGKADSFIVAKDGVATRTGRIPCRKKVEAVRKYRRLFGTYLRLQ